MHHALMSGALPKRELLWHMRRVAASPPYTGKLNPQWAAQNGLAGEDSCLHMLRPYVQTGLSAIVLTLLFLI